jgi:hypothetical protein
LEESEADPYFRLYSEGFAQRAEHSTWDQGTWHMADEDDEWLTWCRAREGWLAGEFLRRVDTGEDVRDFFGSWYAIEGHSQAGYYLGHRVIQSFEGEGLTLREIAVWPAADVRRRVWAALRNLARG